MNTAEVRLKHITDLTVNELLSQYFTYKHLVDEYKQKMEEIKKVLRDDYKIGINETYETEVDGEKIVVYSYKQNREYVDKNKLKELAEDIYNEVVSTREVEGYTIKVVNE
jgi:hypothetical protein